MTGLLKSFAAEKVSLILREDSPMYLSEKDAAGIEKYGICNALESA